MTAGVRRAAGVLHWAAGMVSTTPSQPESAGSPFRFDWAELAGALGDLGVLVPIAVALIVKNGLTPAAVLLPAGLLDWDAKSVPAADHSGNSTLGRTAALSVGLETGVRDAEGVQRPSALDLAGVTLVVIAVALLLRRRQITLVFITIAPAAIVLTFRGSVTFGPSSVHFPHLSRAAVHP